VSKKRKTKLNRSLTLGDIDLDLEKAYQFVNDRKHADAKKALSRARRRLNRIRGIPRDSESGGSARSAK
jgi:hypothetical protein